MRYQWMTVGLLALMLGGGRLPLYAQAEDAAYQEALRRIQEAAQSNATGLSLGGLNLAAVPPEIGQFAKLQVLYLSSNQLTGLPPEIGQLAQLEYLYLDSNQLTAVPPEIGQLTQLQVLYLSNNQLTSLPRRITWLTSLNMDRFDVSHNPLAYPPPEVVAEGTDAIFAFLRRPYPLPPRAWTPTVAWVMAGLGAALYGMLWLLGRLWSAV
jgi:Leucine-rich repeat (LRR) protein